jgi:hypothetical protein
MRFNPKSLSHTHVIVILTAVEVSTQVDNSASVRICFTKS